MANEEEKDKEAQLADLKRAYIQSRMTLVVAALTAGVSVSTAKRWKLKAELKGDNWDSQRAALVMSGGDIGELVKSVVVSMLVQCEATMQKLETETLDAELRVKLQTSLVDGLTKMQSILARLAPDPVQSLSIAMDVVKKLSKYIEEKHPENINDFLEIVEGFCNELPNLYNA